MELFSADARGEPEPARYGEPLYAYLDRAGGEYWARLRSLAQSWADEFPIDESWIGRFSSPDNRQHFGAFWELYIATVYRCAGMKVQWLEAGEPSETARTPDLLISGGENFFVEATTATGTSDQLGADRRLQTILDLLNTMDIPNFWLWPRIVKAGNGQPPTKRLRYELEAWTSSLDPDLTDTKLSYQASSPERPSFHWESEGWKIEFAVVAKPPGERGSNSTRTVGLFGPSAARAIDEVTPLRNALARKSASNYDHAIQGRPYVVAVSSHRKWAFESSMDQRVADAVYGREVFRFMQGQDGETTVQPDRKRDGYWSGEHGPEHTQVSAVLVVNNLWIGEVASKTPTLWVNPWAASPLDELRPWRTALPNDGEVQFRDPAAALHRVLGLEEAWPGVEPFPDT